jgi:hypothetical protein
MLIYDLLNFRLKGWVLEEFLPRSIVNHLTYSTLFGARVRALKIIQKKQQEAEQLKKD